MRYVGTVSRGIRLPVITRGDDVIKIISDCIINAAESERDSFTIRDRDVIGVTESLVARSQGNYVTLADISADIAGKFPEGDVAIFAPILSRNRFCQLLRGIVNGIKGQVHIILTYPNDEVGNQLIEFHVVVLLSAMSRFRWFVLYHICICRLQIDCAPRFRRGPWR